MFTNYPVNDVNTGQVYYSDDERFFLAPFLIGGLAGTALGFGISNNNQLNHSSYQPYPMMPMYYSYPMVPYYSTSNNYYY